MQNALRRQRVDEAVALALRERTGIAVTTAEIYESAFDALDFLPTEDDVRRSLRDLVKTTSGYAKLARDVYAWAPDGELPPPPAPAHVQEMIRRRWQGETLDDIGVDFGVSRERVRQLMVKYGGPTADEVRDIQAARAESDEQARRDDFQVEIRQHLAETGPVSVADLAARMQADAADVAKYWPVEFAHLKLWQAGNIEARWTDDEILAAIREAAVYEFPLTANAYSELIAIGQVEGPSLPRVGQRFGTWSAACEAAGVVSGQSPRPHYDSHWSDADILGIVRRYLEDPAAPNSIQGYDAWRPKNAPDGPSGQTIRNRFRSWTDVKRIALSVLPPTDEGVSHE